MIEPGKSVEILMADDDADDQVDGHKRLWRSTA